MKLAFYYHIAIKIQEDSIKIPSFLGVFIDSLAHQVGQLVVIAHEANVHEARDCDYELYSKNIRIVCLGLKTPAWHREIFHCKILKKALQKIEDCDALIIRSPTPLAAYFHKYLNGPKLWFMIVGDYLEAIEHYRNSSFRNRLIYYYLHFNDYRFQERIKQTDILVNSPALLNKYKEKSKSIHQIRTTTLFGSDFFKRDDTCINQPIEILYTGQFSPAKGLFELIDALNDLLKSGILVRLHLAGWEYEINKPVEKSLKEVAKKYGIENEVIFHGKKRVGSELNAVYRMTDIYVMPSYHEGFPRTIWEAMANSLPVIATAVGGIPEILEHEKSAYLIIPKSSDEIANALRIVILDASLRQKLIRIGYTLAKENTLEIQTKKLVEIIKNNAQ